MGIKLFNYIKKYRTKIILSVIINIFTILSNISLPYLQGLMVSMIEEQEIVLSRFTLLFILIIAMYVVWNGSSIVNDGIFEEINKNIENDIRFDCISRIYSSKLQCIVDTSDGEIISRITRDSKSINKIFENIYSYAFTLFNTLILVVAMFLIDIEYSLILIIIYVLVIVVQKYTSKKLKTAFTDYKNAEDQMYNTFSDQLRGIMTAKVLNNEKVLLERFKLKSNNNIKAFKNIVLHLGVVRYGNFIILGIFKVSTIFIGGLLYLNGSVSIAIIFTMFAYAQQLSALLRKLIEVDVLKKDMYSSIDRLNEFVSKFDGYNDEEKQAIVSIHNIKCEELSYAIDGRVIFEDISFEAKLGDVVIIKGMNGSGKTSLSYFISGLISSDKILFNGINRNSISTRSILPRISYVLQNTYIFPGTVYDNLTNYNEISIEKVKEVILRFDLEDFFSVYGENYDKMITDKNLNISGGEKQAIAFVRALCKDFDVLILDELDNSLDKSIKERIIEGLKKNFDDKIIFIISHDNELMDLSSKMIELGV